MTKCCEKQFVFTGDEGTNHYCCPDHCCAPKPAALCEQCKQPITGLPQGWTPPNQEGTIHGVICDTCCPHRLRYEFPAYDVRNKLNNVCADGCGKKLGKDVPVWEKPATLVEVECERGILSCGHDIACWENGRCSNCVAVESLTIAKPEADSSWEKEFDKTFRVDNSPMNLKGELGPMFHDREGRPVGQLTPQSFKAFIRDLLTRQRQELEKAQEEAVDELYAAIDLTGAHSDGLLGRDYGIGFEDCAEAVLRRFDFTRNKQEETRKAQGERKK